MEKKTIKRLCPFKMLGREEDWLNDMLQKGWLLKKVRMGVYTFEECNNAAQYIRICNALYLDEEIRENPGFKKGRLLFRTGYNRISKEYAEDGICYYIFSDDTEERIRVSLPNRYKWIKYEVSGDRMWIIILVVAAIGAIYFKNIFFAAYFLFFSIYRFRTHIARYRRYRILLKQMKDSDNTEQRTNE